MKKLLLSFMAMFLVFGTAMADDKKEDDVQAFTSPEVYPNSEELETTVYNISMKFSKDITVTLPEGGIDVVNNNTKEVVKITRFSGVDQWEPNVVRFLFEQKKVIGKEGKEELQDQYITTPGTYVYTIPEAVIKATDGEVFPETTFTFTIASTFPITGCSPLTTDKIEKLDFTFDKEVAEVVIPTNMALLDNFYWSPIAYFKDYSISEDKKTVTLELDAPVTEAGIYNLNVPEGVFISADGEINTSAYYMLEIADLTPAFMTNLNDGDRVQELGNLMIGFKNVNEVVLAEDKEVTAYLPSQGESKGTATYADGIITVTFDKELTEEGTYYFVIPEGMFTMDGVPNEERMLTIELFTFAITPLQVLNVTPVENEVESISKIVVKYNQLVSLSYDEEGRTPSQEIMLTCGDKQYKLSYAPEGWNVTDEIVYLVNAEWNGYEYTSTPITEAGTYTLNLADIIVDHAGEETTDEWGWQTIVWHSKGQYCTGTCTWTISGEDSSISTTNAAEGEQVIYDLLGRRVEKITGAGIYIVNGKKIVIK